MSTVKCDSNLITNYFEGMGMNNQKSKTWKDIIDEFSANSNVGLYLKGLEHLNTKENQKLYDEKYFPIIQSEKPGWNPFLSVIIRTQGKREEGLREALLCLMAQECQDFEIILIAHKADEAHCEIIEEILEDQDDEFRKKIRFFKLDEGTRTTPLNYGFSHAWGKYAAVFDDDDILFSNWVDEFKKCAEQNNGRILHSFAFAQDWENLKGLGYCAMTAPISNYCVPFNLINQLSVNRCPLMTLAFPLNIFKKVGIIFNESLNVTEDWEYFMRVAFLCGVSDITAPTAIYRFWKNIETSATLHDQDNWDETYHSVQETYNKQNIILPSGNIKRIIELSTTGASQNIVNDNGEMVSQLFFSKGEKFNDNQVIQSVNKTELPQLDIWFLFEEKSNELTAMRFDLCEEGLFILKNFSIDIWFTNGEKKVLTLDDCVHNGMEQKNGVFFINPDPEIVWEIKDERLVDVVNVKGEYERCMKTKGWINTLLNIFPLKKCFKKRELHNKGYF